MADLGLLSGLAEGISKGMDSYTEARQRRLQNQEGLLSKGLIQDDNGAVQLNPLKQKEQQYSLESYDPNSDTSKRRVEQAIAYSDSLNPGSADQIRKALTGASAKDIDEGLAGKYIAAQGGVQGRQAIAGAMREGNVIKGKAIDLQGKKFANTMEQQANKIPDTVNKDQIMVGLSKQQNKIRNGMHTLEGGGKINPQLFDEVQADLAAAISQGGSSAVTEQRKKELDFINKDWANIKQKLLNRPEDIKSPEMVQQLKNIGKRLDDAYSQNMADRTNSLLQSKKYEVNPYAKSAMERTKDQFAKPKGLISDNAHPLDSVAVQWAKANPNDPNAIEILKANGVQ